MYRIYTYNYDFSDADDRRLVYSPGSDKYTVTAASLSEETGSAGEFAFTIPYGNPSYGLMQRLITMIAVVRDTKVVWAGRVYSIKRDFNLNKTITCEGLPAMLNDICVMPFNFVHQEQAPDYQGGTITKAVSEKRSRYEYLTTLMNLFSFRKNTGCITVTPSGEVRTE